MADVLPSELVSSIMGKLYDVLTNGDDTVPQSEDNFFSWATPGIPVEPADFDFLSQGLTGVVKKASLDVLTGAAATATPPADGTTGPASQSIELTPALLDELRAADTAQMYQQAENLARLVDFVPDVTSTGNDQFARLNVLNNEGSLSDIYSYTLRMSQVMDTELPEETKKKIAELRAFLSVTVKKKNLIDGSETEVSEPSPLTKIYFEKLAAFETAALEYNSRRINALSASTPEDVHYWAINANILRNRVKAAMMDWVSNGYKNDYEEIAAFLDQVMQRDMSLLKQEYRDDLEKARVTGLASGSDFFYTSLIPGNFAKSSGWTEFSFSSGDFASSSSSSHSTRKWKASGSAGFLGIFGGSGGGGVSSGRSEYHGKFNSDHLSLSFEIAQVPIVRTWLKQSFLQSKSWRFDQNNPEAKDELISDGAKPPKGKMPAYPTTAIFIRDLRMSLGHSEGFSDFLSQSTSSSANGGGFLSIGPFFGGGSYSRSTSSGSTEHSRGYSYNNQELNVPGMQLVGYKCHVMSEKCPDPLSTITKWI
ncbi:MAG: hypothetical protein ACR2FP_03445 [Nocardioidaceae bacterium]